MSNRSEQSIQTKLLYDRALKSLSDQLGHAARSGVRESRILLANELILKGISLDIARAQTVLSHTFNGYVRRNVAAPPDYTSPHVFGQVWADHASCPLQGHEMWNEGRRASNLGMDYSLDSNNLPINPYFNFGINGRGVVGRYGPNHAIDIAPCRMRGDRDGKLSLHVLGITRHDTHRPALCGGFVEFNRASNGTYPYPRRVSVMSQVREFFEEMISGSVCLFGPYRDGVNEEVDRQCQQRVDQGVVLTDQQKLTICNQVITYRKWQQIKAEDPAFLARLTRAIAHAHECYAGPVMASTRNTNSAWMETRLSWFHLGTSQWVKIKGFEHKFDYYFSQGDDAEGVSWHKISPELIDQSADHGAFFCYVLASYMLSDEMSSSLPHRELDEQAHHVIEYLKDLGNDFTH